MAGHSHWAGIKHKKAKEDAKRGKIFSKLSKLIMRAARDGADPEYNVKLRHAIEKAKSYNMPKDKIESCIKKGSGQMEGYDLQEYLYEGYSPEGIAIMVDTLTENKNRTTPEIRNIFEKYGGNLGDPGSVSWKFTTKALFVVSDLDLDDDEFLEMMIDAGMDDYTGSDGEFEIYAPVEMFSEIRDILEEESIEYEAEITKIPNTSIVLDKEGYQKVLPLMDALEDYDDVQEVYADFDVPDDVLKAVEGDDE